MLAAHLLAFFFMWTGEGISVTANTGSLQGRDEIFQSIHIVKEKFHD